MVVVADSDCIRKLAFCSFLGEFLQLVKAPPNDVWVLPALPFQLKKKLSSCKEAQFDFDKFIKKVKIIPSATTAMLARFESLDDGEQQLFALLCDTDRVELIVTGDKRAIGKVAALVDKDPSLGALMEGSEIWCFEAIVLRLIRSRGFSITNARMNLWRQRQGEDMDGVMKVAFCTNCTEESVVNELESRIKVLQATCTGMPVRS